MKYRPSDAELLRAIAELLADEVMPALSGELLHKVRVAANLARILERQEAVEPEAVERERQLLVRLLGGEGDFRDLRAELDRRIRESDPGLDDSQVWDVLVSTARDDLAASKPGYDSWEGE